MAKTKGPLMSISASGTIGKKLIYQKNIAGKYTRKYNKPSGTPSISQELIREYYEEGVENWKAFSDEERQEWNEYVEGE